MILLPSYRPSTPGQGGKLGVSPFSHTIRIDRTTLLPLFVRLGCSLVRLFLASSSLRLGLRDLAAGFLPQSTHR